MNDNVHDNCHFSTTVELVLRVQSLQIMNELIEIVLQACL